MAQSKSKQAQSRRAKKPTRQTGRRRRRAAAGSEFALAAFAHDIRTSLTGILALSELMASSNLGERERRWAASIKTGAEHLAALTALVVDAGKADAGTLVLQQETFRPARVIEALAESLSARAHTKGLDAEVAVAPGIPDYLVGDAVRLRSAIENLIDNAVKFTERGAVRLDVRAARAGRGRVKLILAVSDSGIGLTRAEIKRLFRPFTQANAGIARRFGGAGLGLAIVKRLAELMGGNLTVSNAPDHGARFSFSAILPIASAAPEADGPAPTADVPQRSLSILCVEDNAYGRVILNTILTELGHRVDFVGSGEECVAAIGRGYDAVLMDITLPGIDGMEATRRIRALPGSPGRTPIIGITGRGESGDNAAARAAGMQFYLHKPMSPGALSAALAAVLKHSGAERSEEPGIRPR